MTAKPATPAAKPRVVLVIEDNRSLREGLAMNLRMAGYEVLTAADGDVGMQMAFDTRPDLIVLDIMMPGWTGLDILEELRKRGNDVPVLILSARGTPPDKVGGLKLGADDYMGKPFDLPELLARIEVMLRRHHASTQAEPELVAGNITIAPTTRTVRVRGKTVELSAREFDVLHLLAQSPGKVFTREAILERLWGWDYDGTPRTVDNFVASIRKKLGRGRRGPTPIRTVPRVGYTFD